MRIGQVRKEGGAEQVIPFLLLVVVLLQLISCYSSPEGPEDPPSMTGTWVCRTPDSPDTLIMVELQHYYLDEDWAPRAEGFYGPGRWYGLESDGVWAPCSVSGVNRRDRGSFRIHLDNTRPSALFVDCVFTWEGGNSVRFNFQYWYGQPTPEGLEPEQYFLLVRQ